MCLCACVRTAHIDSHIQNAKICTHTWMKWINIERRRRRWLRSAKINSQILFAGYDTHSRSVFNLHNFNCISLCMHLLFYMRENCRHSTHKNFRVLDIGDELKWNQPLSAPHLLPDTLQNVQRECDILSLFLQIHAKQQIRYFVINLRIQWKRVRPILLHISNQMRMIINVGTSRTFLLPELKCNRWLWWFLL